MLPDQHLKAIVEQLKRIADNGEELNRILETKIEGVAQEIAELKAVVESKGST